MTQKMTHQDDRPVPHDPVVARFLVARMAARRREEWRSATLGYCLAWLLAMGPRSPRRSTRSAPTSGPVERRSSNGQLRSTVQSRTLAVVGPIRLEPRVVPF